MPRALRPHRSQQPSLPRWDADVPLQDPKVHLLQLLEATRLQGQLGDSWQWRRTEAVRQFKGA